MVRLLLADDHAIVRSGLKQLFLLDGSIELVSEAVNGSAVLEQLHYGSYDILLMDMTMPGIHGVDLLARIRAHYPDLPILVLSMHNEAQVVARALKAGANGYLTKDSEPEKLLAAIHKVASGGRVIDPSLAELLAFESVQTNQRAPHALLSDREFEIFRLLAVGKGVNEIAEQLAISNKTVSTHKVRLLEKMHLSSTADIVRYAVQNNLA